MLVEVECGSLQLELEWTGLGWVDVDTFVLVGTGRDIQRPLLFLMCFRA
jgi:hypothetical protein